MISFLGTEDRVIYSILKTHSQNDFEKKKKHEKKNGLKAQDVFISNNKGNIKMKVVCLASP